MATAILHYFCAKCITAVHQNRERLQLTLTERPGTLAAMLTRRYGMMTTTMMTATPKRVAVASS